MRTLSQTDTGSYDPRILYPPPVAPVLPRPASGWRPFDPEPEAPTAAADRARQTAADATHRPIDGVEAARCDLVAALASEGHAIPSWPRLDWQQYLSGIDLAERSAARDLKELEDRAVDYRTWRTAAYLVEEIDRRNGGGTTSPASPEELKAERQRWDAEREAYGLTAQKLRQLRREVERLGSKLRQAS